jgi:pimeloyl-ACP methyl ester carboxylesterase
MQKEMFFINDIFCEHYKGKSKHLVVFFPGFPSLPVSTEFIHRDLNIIMPRYPGTWESDGRFSHKNNIDQMAKLCRFLLRFNQKLVFYPVVMVL